MVNEFIEEVPLKADRLVENRRQLQKLNLYSLMLDNELSFKKLFEYGCRKVAGAIVA